METRTALITGITGQDGSFLAELLLKKNCKVFGFVHRSNSHTFDNIRHLLNDINLINGDIGDYISVINAIKTSMPDEIYNLGAQSLVATSWQQAEYTSNITGLGALRVFEAVRQVGDYLGKQIKIYQASSSEQFGNVPSPQNEDTKFVPRSPYGIAKVFAHNSARVYRESYDQFISCGILFNHESERRKIAFVSMKIANAVAKINAGLQDILKLGNLDVKRDWGYAKDYVEAMYLMLQQEKPDDFVIASGKSHTVKDFVREAFNHVNLNWQNYVEIDQSLIRPAEIFDLRGDSSKVKRIIGWKPKTSFEELVHIMVDSEIEKLEKHTEGK